jgi:glycosyltransferase involved in cell wall biosynthesis
MVERVIFPFRGAELGGSHLAAFTLATALQGSRGVRCTVLAAEGTAITAEAHRRGFDVIASEEAPTGANHLPTDISRAPRRKRILTSALGLRRDAIVHCSDINTLRSWGVAARWAGLPVLYHHHALNRLWWPPHLASIAFANEVVCVSAATLDAVRPFRRSAIKELNPFCLDLKIDRASARAALIRELSWPENVRIVGWVGNFWKRKRPEFFVQTARQLAARDEAFRFVMFGRNGDVEAQSLHMMICNIGLEGRVILPGFRPDVSANLACLDLLLAPAPREPFGRTLVEAQMLGTPIVATSGAGHSEIIERWGGGVLAPQDAGPNVVATLCEEVISNANKYVLTEAPRAVMAKEMSPTAHADRMIRIYRQAQRHFPEFAPSLSAAQTRS